MRLPSLAAVLATLIPSIAMADDISQRLTSYENETRQLGSDVALPNTSTGAAGQRRLVDAQVAFSLGDYDAAALILFDIVGKQQGPDAETATYYLAESLLQKGDRGAARTYFKQIVDANNTGSKYFAPSVQRLLEIAIQQRDTAGGAEALAALDRGPRVPSVPYSKGKYAFAQGQFDEAITAFGEVPKNSDLELQALYYSGAAQVAKKDLDKAVAIYTDLIGRKPRTSNDRRVIELGQLALGRLYYEQEQPSKSIDAYLLVDRHSDLFPDALYEVAWVYVKSKQYDKALRALELLEQSDPNTTKTPTVRILEGNLRIRKAQLIRNAQITGTINPNETSDPATEYDKASAIFADTHAQYRPAYDALVQMVDGNLDPSSFLEQISGRNAHVFQISAPIPEAAAQWLRDQPEVQRFVTVENDIAAVQTNIRQTEETITRLEAVLSAPDHSTLYPNLASRRSRIAAIEEDLNKLRAQLADEQLLTTTSGGELAGLTATRKQAAEAYATLGNPEQAYAERVSAQQAGYDKVDTDAAEIDGIIDSTQAVAVALRMHANSGAVAPDQKANALKELDAAAREAQAIEDELADIHREVVLGKDLAGIGDEGLVQAREARRKLRAALDAEARVLGPQSKAGALIDRATKLAEQLAQLDSQIAGVVEQGVTEARGQLDGAKRELAAYRQELVGYEADSRAMGGTVLAASFKEVKDKLYDVVIRTDVGTVDVAWSQKEDSDDDLKRLNLARSRELKQLRDEFRDILEAATKKPSEPKKEPMPAPTEGSTSPDKGGPEQRVRPVEEAPKDPKNPNVRPDTKTTPKTNAPKKGGAK